MEWGKINPVEVVSVNLSKVPDIDLLVCITIFNGAVSQEKNRTRQTHTAPPKN
jgi:hypothetical protein